MVIALSDPKEFSIYLHIPFCKKKCDYCHFYVIPDKEQHKHLLLDALMLEWDLLLQKLPKNNQLKSIYFGGGTPSLFGPERVKAVLDKIRKSFKEDVEVTLEVNPEDVTYELISEYMNVGINRISMGVQSLDDGELQLLTRRHDAKKALYAVEEIVRAGISNLSIDLMYDLPHQTNTSWEKTITTASSLPITHLSLYNLTIEPHTVFHKYKNQLTKHLPSETSSFQMYTRATNLLEKAGLRQYEVSAFAKDGCYSRHNTGYWTGRPFLGLGPSAYSFWKGNRYRNVANINRYAQQLQKGLIPVETVDGLPDEDRKKELLVVALRLIDGINLEYFEELHGPLPSSTNKSLNDLIDNQLLVLDNGHLKLTKRGILLYDSIATELI
ncbi:MAG: radical SAM family heme chaperone HemW [Chlamydiota bacterium]